MAKGEENGDEWCGVSVLDQGVAMAPKCTAPPFPYALMQIFKDKARKLEIVFPTNAKSTFEGCILFFRRLFLQRSGTATVVWS